MSRYPEVLFGGQAGPGKTSALLMAATQYVHIPGYAAMLFRRTYQDLSLPGALMTGHRNGLGILRPDGMKQQKPGSFLVGLPSRLGIWILKTTSIATKAPSYSSLVSMSSLN
jgi:hypothetical protein